MSIQTISRTHASRSRPAPRWRLGALALALMVGVLGAASAQAQATTPFSVGFQIGFGGSLDESETDLDNFGWQGVFLYEMERNTFFGTRLGQMRLGTGDAGPLDDADLTYLTVAGEYRFPGTLGESGIYLGLGAYDLDISIPEFEEDLALGLVLGVTGDFKINHRFSVLLELSGHYADLDAAQVFLMVHGGVAYHF